MFIPLKESFTEMSPIDFEKFVLSLLADTVQDIPGAIVQHNVLMKAADGEYQIDGVIRFEVMGANYLTLVECKMYNGPVSREKVQVLHEKMRSLGAQKAILVTTSYFQSGAIDYASSHGIALVQVIDGKLTYEVRSKYRTNISYPPDLPRFVGIAQYRINDSSIGCNNVLQTRYLSEFIYTLAPTD